MEKQLFTLFRKRYPIYYGCDILPQLNSLLVRHKCGNKIIIISNKPLYRLYGRMISNLIDARRFQVCWLMVKTGEQSKTLSAIHRLYQKLAIFQADRSSTIIALGGGMIQDLGCYAAATYRRGVKFVQIPTTLLIQADINLGGCAINHPQGKSLIGTFYPPEFVLTDLSFLRTLPPLEISNGLAEIINKVVCIGGMKLADIESDITKMRQLRMDTLLQYIMLTNTVKGSIIKRDQNGTRGKRFLLDWGHTLTYAIEKTRNYRISHGQALGIGMMGAAWLSHELCGLSWVQINRLKTLITTADLPLSLTPDDNPIQLLKAMSTDQKVHNGKIRFVLMTDFGRMLLSSPLDENIILNMIDALQVQF